MGIIKDMIMAVEVDTTTKAMSKEEISKRDTIIRDMIKDTEAVTITTMAMEIEVVVTLVIRAMDWKRAQRNMRILIMMQNLDQNILKMVILISHRVTILRDQQVMVKNQIKMVRNLNKMERNQANRRSRI